MGAGKTATPEADRHKSNEHRHTGSEDRNDIPSGRHTPSGDRHADGRKTVRSTAGYEVESRMPVDE
ncbi:hypothetical protein [Alkalicoccus urumqiensis]|uniref:hypothetical protein n=1 Tax=Alkalicoccus urumqiensis TaxID=1548213 RepID=UPI00115A154B|nr:hypothetical protein [Alkalicoccus urumqiensis]